jgi:hypothetical protein
MDVGRFCDRIDLQQGSRDQHQLRGREAPSTNFAATHHSRSGSASADPNITITYDVDPIKVAATRKDALAQFPKNRTLVAVPHLPFPGHFKAIGQGYEWVPVLYENRNFNENAIYQDPHKKWR